MMDKLGCHGIIAEYIESLCLHESVVPYSSTQTFSLKCPSRLQPQPAVGAYRRNFLLKGHFASKYVPFQ